MPSLAKITPKLILLFQAGFAGVLLGQILKLAFYQQTEFRLNLLLSGGLLLLGVLLYVNKKRLQLFIFRWFHFNWISFSSCILAGAILMLLLSHIFFKFQESRWILYVVQLGSILALFMVMAESLLLRLSVLPEVYVRLLQVPNGKVFANYLLWLAFLGAFTFIYFFSFRYSDPDLLQILQHTLYLNGLLFLLLTGTQVVFQKRFATLGKEKFCGPPLLDEERAFAGLYVQKDYFFLTKSLEKNILEAKREGLPLIFSKIRQIPLIDGVGVLEHVQQMHLPDDDELGYTLYFLKKLRAGLKSDSNFDIDELNNLTEIKGYIRTVIESGNPMLVQKLLNDSRPEVKKAAVFAATNFREPSLIPSLVNLLKDPEFAFSAVDALYEFGDQSLPYLRSAKYRNKENGFFIERCLDVAGRFKSPEAGDFLLEMLNEPQKRIQSAAALALLRNEFPLTPLQKTQILNLIESTIALIAILHEVLCTINKDADLMLYEALEEEEKGKREVVLHLLATFLSRPVFTLLKSLLLQNSRQNLPALFSLIDLYLPLVLRKKCKILFSSTPTQSIAKKLQTEYLHEQVFYNYTSQHEAVRQILRLDYGQIGYWLRANAMKHLALVPAQQPSVQIISEIFNQNLLLQEVAAEVLYDLSFDYYFLYMQRLPQERAKTIRHKIETHKATAGEEIGYEGQLFYYQIVFLRSLPLFRACTTESLARNIHLFSLLSFKENKRRLKFDPYKPNGYWIVFEGEFTIYHRGEPLLEGSRGDIIDMSFLTETAEDEVSLQPKGAVKIYFIEYAAFNKIYLKSLNYKKYITEPRLNYSAKLQLA